tara:strand:- start:872 stop:1129 length:258 start_codon:yes stop_codon:yes gene_type:complete
MSPIEFIFALLERFVPISPTKIEQLNAEGKDWWKKMVDQNENPTGLLVPIKKHSNEWYVQSGLAVLFIFAVKSVSNWMNGDSDQD